MYVYMYIYIYIFLSSNIYIRAIFILKIQISCVNLLNLRVFCLLDSTILAK